ncbi:MAG: helix-turn-helix domain-containing protein [bacterium]
MLTGLQNLGLSEKEANVYLAALELGSSSIQKIARKAGVNRATTYVMIESLIKKGMVSSFEQGKKRFFAATHPSQLLRLIKQKESDIHVLRENLEKDLLPQLLSIHNISGDKPRVRFFEGKAGLQAMCDDFLRTTDKKIEAIYPLEGYSKIFTEKENEQYKKARERKNINVQAIYTSIAGQKLQNNKHSIRIRVSHKEFPLEADITLYNNKTGIASFAKEKPIGVIIEDKHITQTLRSLFKLAWEGTKKFREDC